MHAPDAVTRRKAALLDRMADLAAERGERTRRVFAGLLKEAARTLWAAGAARAACHDCRRPYGAEYGFPDLVVPHDVWNRHLSPTGDGGGLLCPSCMAKRASAAGLCDVPAVFTSGPFAVLDPAAVAATLGNGRKDG